MAKKKKKKGKGTPTKKGGGSMMKMRGGFRSMLGGKQKKGSNRADPKQFGYIMLALFVVGVLMFFASR